jgi:hypothetical protein
MSRAFFTNAWGAKDRASGDGLEKEENDSISSRLSSRNPVTAEPGDCHKGSPCLAMTNGLVNYPNKTTT